MPVAKPTTSTNRFITFATFVLVIAVLRVADDVMIPIALAFLLAFLLSPLVVRLTRWKLPRNLAITLTAGLAFVAIGLAAWQITNQAVALVGELPGYEKNLHRKISTLKQPQISGTLSRAFTTLGQMWTELQATASSTPTATTNESAARIQAIQVKATDRTPFELAGQIIGQLFRPLGTAVIVMVFVVAILFQREDLRSRFIRVVSGGHLNIATEAVDDAAQRVSRYLLAQLLVNTCFGITIGLGLWAISVPHAPLWGLLATILRFIPFLGPVIAGSFPIVLSIAVDPGWTMLFWTAGLFVAAELITANVVEVLFYGTKTGISTLALLVAAVFWSWLWGIAGLFLSTPVTVCLLVLGQYVTGLKFLSVLLGSEPPLRPSAQFYQTMLSMNQEEMFDIATDYVGQHSITAFYDDVFVPALLMSEVDRHNGVLAEVRQKFIIESGRELIDELGQRSDATRIREGLPSGDFSAAARMSFVPTIIGVPARDEADELVGLMLAHLLRENGLTVNVVSAAAQPETYQDLLKPDGITAFVSALPPSTLSAAGRACRRIKQENSSAKVLVGVWSSEAKPDELKRRLEPAGVDEIVTRLSEATVQIKNVLAAFSESNVPAAEIESTRVLAQNGAKHAATKPEEATDAITRELARAFDVPISLVSVIETDRDFWHSHPESSAPMPVADSSQHDDVFASDQMLIVEDVARDERFSSNPHLIKRGVRFFASTPLRVRGGRLVGNLCILDTRPRAFAGPDRELLQALAARLMETVEPEAKLPKSETALA